MGQIGNVLINLVRMQKAERAQFLASLGKHSIAAAVPIESSARDRMIASMNAYLETKLDKERAQRRRILKPDAYNRNTHSLMELNEVLIDRGEHPILT